MTHSGHHTTWMRRPAEALNPFQDGNWSRQLMLAGRRLYFFTARSGLEVPVVS